MAAFDREHGHIIVRVVYDGPAGAGKTENLARLVETISPQRRGELTSPRGQDGATSYFDWLYLNGGVVAGHPLRAQLVAVPGRGVLSSRRWQIVKTADVVVFVCESTARGAREARRWLELLRANLSAWDRAPPILVQANKQDLQGALDSEALAVALGHPLDTEVVLASAASGAGVRDTVVRAIRAAAGLAEQELLQKGVDGMTEAEESTELLAQLDGSSSMSLALADTGLEAPPLPHADVAVACVWPEAKGRAALRSVTRALATGFAAEEAGPSRVVLRTGEFRLQTSRAHRFENLAAGRAALAEHARARVRIGPLHGDGTTLVLATAEDHATWLWTVSRWSTPLSERMVQADARGDDDALGDALRGYARAAVEALRLAVRNGVLIRGDAAHFGVEADRIAYLGDWIGVGATNDEALGAIVEVASKYQHRSRPCARYLDEVAAALSAAPIGDAVRRQVADALSDAGHTRARPAIGARVSP